ncbi:MAG: helix-hairpin-helix domain-containing protein [Fuerstiella sp.]|nr:helix-hairpin-helix domain-containing protein [Fuerstiella sp.]MCP4858248.1 helix-hairpin-helix domain-containing protein [Fuerstiella sp.]
MTDVTSPAQDNHSHDNTDSVVHLPAVDVGAVSVAADTETEPNTSRAEADELPIESRQGSERDWFLILLGWLFFAVMLTQYLITAFDRPDPLAWQRGPAFQWYRVDVNTGTWVEWMQLEGVGQTMAHRIVADREANGPFPTIDDLTRVDGIGLVTLDRLRSKLTISHEDDEQRIRQRDDGE